VSRRRARLRHACLAAVLVIVAWWPIGVAAKPRIRLIATGGTISNHVNGRLSASALAASVPGLADIAEVDTETFSNVSSVELTLADWLRLSRRVNELLRSAGVTGVVVTSGSDTLEELAWWLDLTTAGPQPVVLTGAIRRPSDTNADGPRNLADAVAVAVAPAARSRGTLVVFGGSILEARDATKLSTRSLEAFAAPGSEPAGRVERGRVRFTRQPASRPTAPKFDVAAVTDLPRVDVLLTYQQAAGDLVDAAVRAGASGIVIASAGAGAVTIGQADAIDAARRNGVPVVVASRVPEGRLTPRDVPKNAIAAVALSPVKARILLMLALSRGMSAADLAAEFRP
jgi:L-asparaginase